MNRNDKKRGEKERGKEKNPRFFCLREVAEGSIFAVSFSEEDTRGNATTGKETGGEATANKEK